MRQGCDPGIKRLRQLQIVRKLRRIWCAVRAKLTVSWNFGIGQDLVAYSLTRLLVGYRSVCIAKQYREVSLNADHLGNPEDDRRIEGFKVNGLKRHSLLSPCEIYLDQVPLIFCPW